jgi:hypothetical protein
MAHQLGERDRLDTVNDIAAALGLRLDLVRDAE